MWTQKEPCLKTKAKRKSLPDTLCTTLTWRSEGSSDPSLNSTIQERIQGGLTGGCKRIKWQRTSSIELMQFYRERFLEVEGAFTKLSSLTIKTDLARWSGGSKVFQWIVLKPESSSRTCQKMHFESYRLWTMTSEHQIVMLGQKGMWPLSIKTNDDNDKGAQLHQMDLGYKGCPALC